jgi:predicted nucleotidyltransferase
LKSYSKLSTIVFNLEYIIINKPGNNKMLKSLYISKSKTRESLLILFFTSPQKKFYLQELRRILGFSAGNIRRELLKFTEDNLLLTEKTGNLLFYMLNKKHPLFDELKSIISKTAGLEYSIKSELTKIDDIKTAFIFGSFASKKENDNSDIDLMVIGNPDISKLNNKILILENKLKREINPVVYSEEEYKAKKNYESQFILDIIKKPKIILIGKENDL